ncbi:glutathione-dependent formaldehyde-activating enzyme [Stachybotrys elegans]|uniref:Glutathione-dependent formaldehyde-activating enzyme n=1 Tax=Stachybotrys elegans TaxID=80388 RepID=A0A8K0SWL9_9HYPO|nr:glutathione-dependent formaldehyde-activating enzyme [Stachybotrys elegans]
MESLKTYRGNCHCGAFVYEVMVPELTLAGECNCSYCYKKGYLYSFVSPDRFKVVKGGEDTLRVYTFGTGRVLHKFCPKCSSGVLAENLNHPVEKRIAFNVHTIQHIDQWGLERFFETSNANIGEPYVHPPHTGGQPKVDVDSERIYTGGCHCGALTVAVASKPLDETFDGMLNQCNCSICEHIGGIWTYPTKEKVVLVGSPSYYTMGVGFMRKSFCSTCGINIANSWNADFTREQEDALPEESKQFILGAKVMHPINLRVLPDVDLGKLKVNRVDGWSRTPPEYVYP